MAGSHAPGTPPAAPAAAPHAGRPYDAHHEASDQVRAAARLNQKPASITSLDPQAIIISETAPTHLSPGISVINVMALDAMLAAANIKLDAGSIMLAPGAVLTWLSNSTLTLQAAATITIAGSVSAPNGLLTVMAAGALADTATSKIAAAGFTLQAGSVTLAGSWTTSGGPIAIAGVNAVTLATSAVIAANGAQGGSVQIGSSQGAVQISGRVSATGATGYGGAITIAGATATNLLGAGIDASGATGGGSVSLGTNRSAAATKALTLDARTAVSANATQGQGGTIEATGTNVTIGSATLDASGSTGGGSIFIGGVPQGTGTLAHAQTVRIASGAMLSADATLDGNGGQIVAWSDQATGVYGTLTATGAGLGNGGSIETSGHVLNVAGIVVNAASPNGAPGRWLVDPYNLTVSNTATTATVSGTNPVTYTSNATTSIVLNTDINAVLNAGTSVVLLTNSGAGASLGNIIVNSAIAKTAGGAASLTMNAYGSIIINASISSTVGAMAVTLNADTGASAAGGYVSVQAPITTLGGALVIGGQGTPLTLPAVGTTVLAPGVTINGALSTSGGNITINGTGLTQAANSNYGVSVTANITNTGTGTITLNGTGSGNGASAQDYGVRVAGGAIVTAVNGLVNVTGTSNSTGTGAGNNGVYVTGAGSTIKSTGTGGVTVIGFGGGTGAGGSNYGVTWNVANGIQSTGGGAISITGT
ncbi:MAG: beta strand repeat-containing protein, partial [Xanthobacteraceae bacterium]